MPKENKKYRPNVAAIVLSPNYPEKVEIFVATRTDIPNAWQFPQGGIDENESPKEALFRELEEEIGTKDIEVVAEYPDWISYDFPDTVAKKMYPYDGQTQKYYLVKLRKDSDINLDTEVPEFNEYTYVSYQDVFEKVTFFKRRIYSEVLKYFSKKGYL